MLQDITERKRGEEEHSLLAAMIEATSDYVGLLDGDGRVIYLNRASRRMWGIGPKDDITQLNMSDFLPDWSLRRVQEEALPTAIRDGSWSGENAILVPDGREIPVSQVIVVNKDASGGLTFIGGSSRDISEQRNLELHLRRTQDEQAALRRVATLVAEDATPDEVFAAVAEEVARLLEVPAISMVRFEADEASTAIAVWGEGNPFGVGATFEPWPGVMLQVRLTGRPARLEDFAYSTGPTTARLQGARIHSGVGVPINVEGRVWGTIIALATGGGSLPLGVAERLSNFTDLVATAIANAEARDALDAFVREQAALRQVATLVAEGAGSPAVYDAVCQETGLVIGATSVNLCHFTADRCNLTMAGWSLHDTHIPSGTRLPIEGGTINELVYESGAPARIETYADAEGALADLIRERGIKSEVAAPVIVDGRLWGSIIAGWDTDGPPPLGAERRLAGFAELVGTAVSNALARSELVASRARIVTAADEARRRIERNLHDGIQQQLVSLQLELKTVDAGVPEELQQTHDDIEHVQGILGTVLDDVREIAQGVHPATLSQWGLEPAIRALARRSPIPVELELGVPGRLPQSAEIAIYYVISEALANVAKHARATHAAVTVSLETGWLRAMIRDDGVGGADTARGSGIPGLVDRVEALGGRLSLMSAPQQGTTVSVALPLEGGSVDGF
jgi:PAS domain S-box-containing protein